MTHTQLGLLDWRTGAFAESRRHLVEALRIHAALGYRFGIAASLEYLGWVAGSRDEPARAAQLVGYANREFERIGVSVITGLVPDRDDATDLMRERLGTERYRVLTEAGARMQQDEIVTLARRDSTTQSASGAQPPDGARARGRGADREEALTQ